MISKEEMLECINLLKKYDFEIIDIHYEEEIGKLDCEDKFIIETIF